MNRRLQSSLDGYDAIAGNLALDFANTMGGCRFTAPKDFLKSYADLIQWGEKVEILSPPQVKELSKTATQDPERAQEIFLRALTLREAIYRVATSRFNKKEADPKDLFLIGREATLALSRAKIVTTKTGFEWEWPESNTDLDRVIWPIARTATRLIMSPQISQVRECHRDGCTWVFLDTSKNHSRRWCVMKDCGNREKVRRFRMR